ncbi:hypothetical protein PYW07_010241 [Mythimna separata]|uniref:NADP-dependent oxidoreductase domain-containing protein n=1 Tax=Mythimna separata TaxID=271217 RepID=A0AAD8DQT9_MYTSE|nr:hypothetical protein PYW07_010241 [Mythimna separata]
MATRRKLDKELKPKHEDLFITSKLWSTYHRTDLVEEACNASLKNLGLSFFDLYLIHNPISFKEGSDSQPKDSIDLISLERF